MPLPSFLILGAAKAGTTALYHQLRQHPDVFLSPVKEPSFFAYDGWPVETAGPGDAESARFLVTDLAAYRSHWHGHREESALGDASPVYLYSPSAPASIARHVPDARMIAILRDPAERAFSHYLHMRRDGREPEDDFERALDIEAERIAAGWSWSWHYVQVGFYGLQVERYLDRFDPRQMRIYLYEDLRRDPRGLIRDVLGFLGVDPGFEPDVSARPNVSGLPRWPAFDRLLRRLLNRPVLVKELGPAIPKAAWLRATRSGTAGAGTYVS